MRHYNLSPYKDLAVPILFGDDTAGLLGVISYAPANIKEMDLSFGFLSALSMLWTSTLPTSRITIVIKCSFHRRELGPFVDLDERDSGDMSPLSRSWAY